jgi:hypothetical protein
LRCWSKRGKCLRTRGFGQQCQGAEQGSSIGSCASTTACKTRHLHAITVLIVRFCEGEHDRGFCLNVITQDTHPSTPSANFQSLRMGLSPHFTQLSSAFSTLPPDWQTRLRPSLVALESCQPLLDQMDRASLGLGSVLRGQPMLRLAVITYLSLMHILFAWWAGTVSSTQLSQVGGICKAADRTCLLRRACRKLVTADHPKQVIWQTKHVAHGPSSYLVHVKAVFGVTSHLKCIFCG